jgi:lysophospholipase L1-like esterase
VATLVVLPVARPAGGVQAAASTRSAAPADGAGDHVVTFLGDSWTFGQGATGLRGYAVLTGEALGWRYDTIGVPGGGYTQTVAGVTFGDLVDTAIAQHPDVLVVEGSLNERNSTPQALDAAAGALFAHLRAVADPGMHVLVLGASYNPGTPDATIDWINATIRAAAERYGLTFVDPAAQDWVDARDPALWHDQNHPDDLGYRMMADRLAPLLRHAVSG